MHSAQEMTRADVAESRSAALVADAESAATALETARQELADTLARDATARATISELTERLTAMEATASATLTERDATSAQAVELEQKLAGIMAELASATSASRGSSSWSQRPLLSVTRLGPSWRSCSSSPRSSRQMRAEPRATSQSSPIVSRTWKRPPPRPQPRGMRNAPER